MGKEAEDVLTSLNLSEAELNDYCIVRRKFSANFIWSVNVVLESKIQHEKARTKRDSKGSYYSLTQTGRFLRLHTTLRGAHLRSYHRAPSRQKAERETPPQR